MTQANPVVERAALQIRVAFNQFVDIETELTDKEARTLVIAVLRSLLPVSEEMVEAMRAELIATGFISKQDPSQLVGDLVRDMFTAAIQCALGGGE